MWLDNYTHINEMSNGYIFWLGNKSYLKRKSLVYTSIAKGNTNTKESIPSESVEQKRNNNVEA
jgi:hypothetical protein